MKYKVCWSKTDKGLRPYLQHPCCAHGIKVFDMFFDNLNDARTFALIEVGEELFEPVSYNDRDFSDEELERASSVDVIDMETGEVEVSATLLSPRMICITFNYCDYGHRQDFEPIQTQRLQGDKVCIR